MLELVARLWERTAGVTRSAAPDQSAERSYPSIAAWRRMLTARSTRSKRVKHLFAIERLRTGTARHPYNYRYFCVRCRWAFWVDGRGGVVAVDGDNRPLEGVVGAYRVGSFAHGPCGAHWASSAVIDGGLKERDRQTAAPTRRAPLTLVSPRRSAVQ